MGRKRRNESKSFNKFLGFLPFFALVMKCDDDISCSDHHRVTYWMEGAGAKAGRADTPASYEDGLTRKPRTCLYTMLKREMVATKMFLASFEGCWRLHTTPTMYRNRPIEKPPNYDQVRECWCCQPGWQQYDWKTQLRPTPSTTVQAKISARQDSDIQAGDIGKHGKEQRLCRKAVALLKPRAT